MREGASLEARRLASLALGRVEEEGAYLHLALRGLLRQHATTPRAAARATALAAGVLRWKTRLDWALQRVSARPLTAVDTPVRQVLRVAAYEIGFTSTPPPIAVDLAVRLTRRLHPEASGFVNAVLRALVRASRDGMPAPAGGPVDERLAITYGHPRWLVRRWLDRFGLATTEAILRANNEPSPPTVRVNLMRTTPASLQRRWAAEGIPSGVGALVSFALEIHLPGRSLEQLPGYDEGLFSPQSEASMLPALVVGSVAGETAADLCSAPGGKATQMAEMAEDQAHVLAFDRHAGRLGLVRRNARRLGLRSLRFAVADARRPPLGAGSLDAVLLDAPCTDLGTVRRRPDVRWRRRPEDVEEMARLQRQLLDAAAGLIRPGGRLVYSVCSFEREETTDHLAYVAERHGMQAVPVEAMAAWRGPRGTGADREGMTLLPHEVRTDGFFVVRFEPLRRV